MKKTTVSIVFRHCFTGALFTFTADANAQFTENSSAAARAHFGDFNFLTVSRS